MKTPAASAKFVAEHPVLGTVDWARHALGQPASWPAEMLTIVQVVMHCRLPMFLAWGPELRMVYNEACIPLMGETHPAAMGAPLDAASAGFARSIKPLIEQALAGRGSPVEEFAFDVLRNGRPAPAWFTLSHSPVLQQGEVAGVLGIIHDVTDAVVQRMRQSYRLELLELLRGLTQADEIKAAASRLLGERLCASRAFYAEIDDIAGSFHIDHDWTDGTLHSLSGVVGSISAYGPLLAARARQGETCVVDDSDCDPLTAESAAAHAQLGRRAFVNVPLVKGGLLIAAVIVHRTAAYHWRPLDIALAEDTAEHTWAAVSRARAEKALQLRILTEANRLRELFELSPSAVAVLRGPAHVVELANQTCFRLLGRRGMVGQPLSQALPDLAAQGVEKMLGAVFASGQPQSSRGTRFLLQPSVDLAPLERYLDVLAHPRFGGSDEVIGVFLQITDSTEMHVAQAALRQSEARFRAAVSAVGVMWTNDAQGRMVGPQPGWTSITGQTEAEYSGYGWTAAVHPDDAGPTVDAWEKAVASGSDFIFEHRLNTADNDWRMFSVRAVPITGPDGDLREWVGVHIDVTARREAEQALRDTDRRKDEFLATLAHELRNPLAPIRTAAHALDRPNLSEAQRGRFSEVIGRQTAHMALLLDDLLDVSRINSGRLALKKEAVALDQVLRTAVEMVQPLVDARQHRLDVTQPPASLVLQADGLRLSQVVTNLLNNAAKYTDPGGVIELSSYLDNAGLHIAVKDNGIGIDAALLPTIFAMFSQVEATMDRSRDGLGIGLSLAKKIVNLHGGTIQASSAGRGQGTTVTVVLPASLVATADTPSGSEEPAVTPTDAGPSLRVMVVDDNVDAAHTFAEVLRLDGHEVVVAHSGKQALELAAGGSLQVAILDIGMPVMNGYQLAHAIRAEPWGRDMLLVALTGWGMESDRQRAFAAGFDHHFTKPTDPFDICKLLVESGGAKMLPP